jgi:hypothetical protein
MRAHTNGFDSLAQAADAVAAYLPHRTKPRSPDGLKKNLRLRDVDSRAERGRVTKVSRETV